LLEIFSNKALANPSIAAADLPDFEGMVGQVILMNALVLVLFIFWQPKTLLSSRFLHCQAW